jgi:hypothetical protein
MGDAVGGGAAGVADVGWGSGVDPVAGDAGIDRSTGEVPGAAGALASSRPMTERISTAWRMRGSWPFSTGTLARMVDPRS